MKIKLSDGERHLIKLWLLSCEDMQLEQGGCGQCAFEGVCGRVIDKLGITKEKEK